MITSVYNQNNNNQHLLVPALLLLAALAHSFSPSIIISSRRHYRENAPPNSLISSDKESARSLLRRKGRRGPDVLDILRFSTAISATEDFNNPVASDARTTVNEIKAKLVQVCADSATTAASKERVHNLVRDLLNAAETAKIGQDSAMSGFLPGRWELIYSNEDDTRSSPFFWAFRQAFPEQSDQIFGITDAIPAPLKEVGPAYQTIEFSAATQTGSLVSRVKVATIGGAATSIMTTRATITGTDGVDGIRLQIDTTKPEDSTVLQALGPLGSMISDNAPAFPSGPALEKVQPGASRVVVRTPFCDEGLRISRNDARPNDVYIWRRVDFVTSEVL